MSLAGTYDVNVKSPMGDQNGVLTIVVDGDRFTGTLSGGLGSMDLEDGKVAGDTITWRMEMKVPMPMSLDCSATVSGDTITGEVKAGVFGSMPLSGTRKA